MRREASAFPGLTKPENMKKNKTRRAALLAAFAAMAASVSTASAAIDLTEVETQITTAKGHAETLGIAAISIAGIFLLIKLVKRGIAKV
jgi:hypothetical protein